MGGELTKQQFHDFRMKCIVDPAGSQEFFHRAIFAIFDADNNGVLDEKELEEFLEILHKSGSFFRGSNVTKLPPVDQLRRIIMKHYDTDNDKTISFEEVRSIIVGEASKEVENDIADAVAKHEEELRKQKEEEELRRKEEEERKRKEEEEKAKSAAISEKKMYEGFWKDANLRLVEVAEENKKLKEEQQMRAREETEILEGGPKKGKEVEA